MGTEQQQSQSSSSPMETRSETSSMRKEAEHLTEEARELWHKVSENPSLRKAGEKMRKPSVGATIAGAAVLAAGAVWGASEAAVAAIAAYAVFRILKKRQRGEQREGRTRVDTSRQDVTPSSPA